MYLETKKTVTVEEGYFVTNCNLSAERLADGLKTGELNMVKVEAVEAILWVVNKTGRRVAVLKKNGGSNSEDFELSVDDRKPIDPWHSPEVHSVSLD